MPNDAYDSPWKDALVDFFQPFLEFFFPAIAAQLDWSAPVVSLDKELSAVTRQARAGPRRTDLLLQARQRNGRPGRFYFQIEVQTQHDRDFARRAYVYHYRVFDRFGEDICSLAILADPSPSWRPQGFSWERFGCRTEFQFPVVKLTDLRPRLDELENNQNPFAAFVSFHLWTQATRRNYKKRAETKARLYRGLFHRGFSRGDIAKLIRLLDWLMALPPPHSLHFLEKLAEYEKEDNVPYISSIEQMGIEKGLEMGRAEGRQEGRAEGRQEGRAEGRQEGQLEGARQMVVSLLVGRFGALPKALEASLAAVTELDELRGLALRAAQIECLEEFSTREA
ncbi:MAG: transposase [Vulcanimicrobiota bacterium]